MVQKFNKYVAKKRLVRRNKPKHLRHQKVLNKHSNMVNSNNKKRGQG